MSLEHRQLPDVAERDAVGAVVVETEGLGAVGVAVVTAYVGEEEVQVAVFHRIVLQSGEIAQGCAILAFLDSAVVLGETFVLHHALDEYVPLRGEAILCLQYEREVFSVVAVAAIGVVAYDARYDSLAVDAFAHIHHVEECIEVVDGHFVTQGDVMALVAAGLAHQGVAPASLEHVAEVTVPVGGIDQGHFRLLVAFAIHVAHAAATAVEHLQLELMVGVELELEVGTGEEVAHVVHHIGILVDFDGVEVELDTTVGCALLTEEHGELVVDFHADTGHVDDADASGRRTCR